MKLRAFTRLSKLTLPLALAVASVTAVASSANALLSDDEQYQEYQYSARETTYTTARPYTAVTQDVAYPRSQLAAPAAPRMCVIGSGRTQVPVGYSDGRNLLALVSKRPGELLTKDFAPSDLVNVPHSVTSPEIIALIDTAVHSEQLRSESGAAALDLIQQARYDGIDLFVHSGYRAYNVQCEVFNGKLNREYEAHPHLAANERAAIASVNQRSALPGQSEHQLGTAVDFVTNIPGMGYKLEPEMDQTEAFRWLEANAHYYGFVLSFPRGAVGSRDVNPTTGYVYEPWHWRFVGARAAGEYRACSDRYVMTVQDFLRYKQRDPYFSCN